MMESNSWLLVYGGKRHREKEKERGSTLELDTKHGPYPLDMNWSANPNDAAYKNGITVPRI